MGWLIDGSGTPAQPAMWIRLQNGILRSIRKSTEAGPDSVKPGQSLLDPDACTLMPALIDSHVHLALPEIARQDPTDIDTSGESHRICRQVKYELNQYVARGIMAVRDGGDAQKRVLRCRNHQDIKGLPIQLKLAGMAWNKPGRYGQLIGRALAPQQNLADIILAAPGEGDHIKIVNSGLNSLTVYHKETTPQFNLAEMTAAVKAARQRGFKTMVHANGKRAVKVALNAGCDSIEHGYFMDTENLRQMADSRTTWVPTAYTMQALKDQMVLHGQAVDVVQQNLDHQIRQIQFAHERGVRIALGTDAGSAGVPHAQALINEMRLFKDAGLPIEKVVACATRNGARLMGLPGAGQIKRDLPANFVAVKGDPLQLPHSLEKIMLYYFDGNKII